MLRPFMLKVRGGSSTYVKPDGKTGTAGKGALWSEDVAFTLSTMQDQTLFAPVDFRHFSIGDPDDATGTLQAKSTGGYSLNYQPGVLIQYPLVEGGDDNADAKEAGREEILRGLRTTDEQEAIPERKAGEQFEFSSEEVLQQSMHGLGVSGEAKEAEPILDDGSLPREENLPSRSMCDMRSERFDRRTPQERGLDRQSSREFDSAVSKLPSEGSSQEEGLCYMRGSTQGAGILRETLPEVQEIRRSTNDGVRTETVESEAWGYVVRRLTPL